MRNIITVYKCDYCGKVLSDDKISLPHFSIEFGRSGYVEKDSVNPKKWVYKVKFPEGQIIQFCDRKCFSKFMTIILRGKNKVKKKK